ncbi:MAG: tyrosine-type recombinase/integrase [Leptospira sp.]|nr:tyrosine-type recombinase/integrase [Leptospira sp.]
MTYLKIYGSIPNIETLEKKYPKLPAIAQYRVGVIRFINWIGSRPINEETLREYFLSLKKEYSPATVRLAKTSIKLWILKNHPNRNDIVFRNGIEAVFKDIKVPKPSLSLTDSKFLSESEVKLLMDKLPTKYSLIIQALYGTGCRVSELLSVRLSQCQILKTHIEAKVVGKGGKENILIISKTLFTKIQKQFKGNVYLFENTSKGKPITRQLVHRTLQRVGLAELDRKVHPHQTRHSRISHLLQNGKPLDSVSRFANHFDPAFTAKVYGHNKLTSKEILETAI